jgi:dephospho-CoA kinase
MKLFGLTGGIGMGKSTSASLLSLGGLPVIDTDVIAREIVEPGQPALTEVAATFGRELIDAEGKLRRAALAEIVFSSPEKLKELESILHPIIRDRWLGQALIWRREGRSAGAVVIPLLFETDAQSHFDAIICTACSAETQRERLSARRWPEKQIQQRIAAQWPVGKKMTASNFVIWTEGSMEMHRQQLERILGGHFASRR